MAYAKENRPPTILLPPCIPIRPHSPAAKPSLALQRDHSACANLSSPLLVRKTREAHLDPGLEVPPPCHGCVKVPQRQKSVSRRVLSAVKQGLSRSDARTPTCSTISTTELVTDFGTTKQSITPPDPTGSFPAPSEEPSECIQQFQTPYIDLQVTTDIGRVDINDRQDIWVAVTATVRLHVMDISEQGDITPRPENDVESTQIIGSIPSLRLLFQAAPRHRVLQTLGHKSAKQMKLGDSCELFVRVRIPKYQSAPAEAATELDDLFTDLESTLGTLESDVLYVEARYKHTIMEESNSILVRRTAKVKRHRPESR